MIRVMLRMRKGDKAKYLSHRDTMRMFEFALRRSRLPIAYSEGFNPRPRMSFGTAIGVGVTSDDERIVLEFSAPVEPDEVKDRLNDQLPVGFQVLEAESLPEGVKSPLGGLNGSEFRLTLECGEGCSPESLREALDGILKSPEMRIVRVREGKSKEIDIRPNILEASVASSDGDRVEVDVALKLTASGGARPHDVVQALGALVPNLTVKGIHRSRQFHAAD